MTTLSERGQVLMSLPIDRELRDWLRQEAKRRRLPQGVIVGRLLRAAMNETPLFSKELTP